MDSSENDADTESSRAFTMAHPLNTNSHHTSYMQEEAAQPVTGAHAVCHDTEEPRLTSYTSSSYIGKESGESNLVSGVSGDSNDPAVFSRIPNGADCMLNTIAGSGQTESTGLCASFFAKFCDDLENLAAAKGYLSSEASSSTVTDFLEGCLDTLDCESETSQAFDYSKIPVLISTPPTCNNAIRDQDDPMTSDHIADLSGTSVPFGNGQHEYLQPQAQPLTLPVPTSSQSEFHSIAQMLIPTNSEGTIFIKNPLQGHPAWSQPVGLPYVRPTYALDIDILSYPEYSGHNLIPARPATPVSGKNKGRDGDPAVVITDPREHNVIPEITLRTSNSVSFYALFGLSPPSSQNSAL